MHDTNTDVNDVGWIEEGCDNAVIHPRVCFWSGPSTASPQSIEPWVMIWAVRIAALHVWVSYCA